MYKISHELKLKLLDASKARCESHMTPIEMNHYGQKIKVPGIAWNEVILDLKDELELFRECELWCHMRMTGHGERCDSKVTMGEYEGLWPTVCDRNKMRVKFLVDVIHVGRSDWRDWFMEGEEYASQ